MILKRYRLGSILILTSLIALSVNVTIAFEQASAVVDKIMSGEVPADSGAITEVLSQSTGGMEGSVANIATLVIAACWLFGIIDSYRLGKRQEK